jgi:predicted RNase H-like nuclease
MALTPRKISTTTEIKDGKFLENRDVIIDAISAYEGKKVTVTIERYYKKRSNKQNRYYWGVIVEHWKNILRQEWGDIYQENEVHEFLKSNLNFQEVVNVSTGEVAINPITHEVIRKPKSTTKNTTYSQEEYHEACRQLAWEMFQYNIPLPKEDLEQPIDVKY